MGSVSSLKESLLTENRLKELLTYDPKTGVFMWRPCMDDSDRLSHIRGEIAGYCTPYYSYRYGYPKRKFRNSGDIRVGGYRRIQIDKKSYAEHRLAWLYMTGKWPEHHIDHINRKKADNRFCNLREATNAQNNYNRAAPKNSTTRYAGVVCTLGHKKSNTTKVYLARVKINGKYVNFGSAEDKYGAAGLRAVGMELLGIGVV